MKFRSLSCSFSLLLLSACGGNADSSNSASGSGLPSFQGNAQPADAESGMAAGADNQQSNNSDANNRTNGNMPGGANAENGPGAVNEASDGSLNLNNQVDGTTTGDGNDNDIPDDNTSTDETQSQDEEEGNVDNTVEQPIATEPPVTLRDAAELSGRLVGVALATFKLNRPGYGEAAQNFNFLTHENDMKWQVLEPQPNQFNFAAADTTIEFAEANDMLVKGHTLVWHSQLPGWARQLTTRQQTLDAMTNHITTIVTRYRGRIHSYDVVNEAFTDGTARQRGANPGDATDAANNGSNGPDSVFRRLIGADYIDRAFQIANDADPDALLFYNDYGAEGMNAKSNAIFQMVEGLVQRGVPIDGVGLQMHINAGGDNGRSANDIAQNITRITNLGLQVHITEMDARLCINGASPEQRRQAQSERFAGIVTACTDNPLCTAVTMWGVSDTDSWRNGTPCDNGSPEPEPLLFDGDYQPKPAYTGMFDAFLNAATNVIP